MTATAYPIGLDVDGPAKQNRLSVALRMFYVFPHVIVLSFLYIALWIAYFVSWPVILATGQYSDGMLKFSLGIWRWSARVGAYAMLLTDKYTPFSMEDDPNYPIRMPVDPQVEGRNRITTFWWLREIMAIPHMLVLFVLFVAVWIVVLIAWVVAIFTAEVPAGFHKFIEGVNRWQVRVGAYIYNFQDQYPPFSLN